MNASARQSKPTKRNKNRIMEGPIRWAQRDASAYYPAPLGSIVWNARRRKAPRAGFGPLQPRYTSHVFRSDRLSDRLTIR
jgi:hypothetical protein